MISFVRGKLVDVLGDKVIIDTGNFGLEINVPMVLINKLPKINEEVLIYTYFKVSEDAMSLYGFNTRKELDIFKLLISVNGVGPKGALAILSILDSYDFALAVISDDEKAISKASGIGVKTAKRIIIELKDKIDLAEFSYTDEELKDNNPVSSAVFKESIEALLSLGYSQSEATKALRSIEIDENMQSSDIIKLAFRVLSRG